jgi:hypothetical protein
VRNDLLLAVPLGAIVQLLVTLAAAKAASGRLALGDLRYP